MSSQSRPARRNRIKQLLTLGAVGTGGVLGLIQRVLAQRDRDKIKLFELHPTDSKTLAANIAQLEAGRQVAILREDGFEGLK